MTIYNVNMQGVNAMLDILTAILIQSSAQKVDPYLVAAVVQVESQFNPQTVGSIGEIGLMQLRPEYFANGRPKDLFNPEMNIRLGIGYLAKIKNRCRHKVGNTFLVCYNAGVTGGSRIKNPSQFPYVVRVSKAYNELKAKQIFERAEVVAAVQEKILAAYSRISIFNMTTSSSIAALMTNERCLPLDQKIQVIPLSYADRRKKFLTLTSKTLSWALPWLG